ncbi:MAG: (2Fe-2S)-binding protein [Rhodospirillaceae bacterium]|nr:MAG: (2Fe-2S)-binding protein [Rhodospirillaceae bacterium]
MAKTADYNIGEYTFPRGWFVVAESTQIGKKPFNAHYFGQDVVIFRGESGAVAMLEAYCPHMGTHFGKSTSSYIMVANRHIEGDSIRCPFHGWRFGPDGKCNNIPYFDGPIPPKARVHSWPVQERYGLVFCWNDPEGLAPDFDLPDYPEWNDPQWVRWSGLDHLGDLPCHPIEIVDNNSDVAHLHYLHGTKVQYYENEVAGPFLYQRESAQPMIHVDHEAIHLMEQGVTTVSRYTGPGLLTGHFLEAGAAQLIAHTPIDDGVTRLWQCALMKSAKPVIDDEVVATARNFNKMMCYGLLQDAEIWATKRPALQVMQIPTDGPFGQSRIWYSQFYNPRAKAPNIVARVQGVHHVKGMPSAPKIAAE